MRNGPVPVFRRGSDPPISWAGWFISRSQKKSLQQLQPRGVCSRLLFPIAIKAQLQKLPRETLPDRLRACRKLQNGLAGHYYFASSCFLHHLSYSVTASSCIWHRQLIHILRGSPPSPRSSSPPELPRSCTAPSPPATAASGYYNQPTLPAGANNCSCFCRACCTIDPICFVNWSDLSRPSSRTRKWISSVSTWVSTFPR